ncbi:FliM/FliN family flagellar motor switch protein [Pseudomonas abietaniphila]
MSPDDEYETPRVDDEGYDDPAQRMHAESDWQAHEDEQPVDAPYLLDDGADDATIHASLTLDPLDQLPMALTLRCGVLSINLGDLRRVAAGTILEVSGVTPGHATLCHGERVVAEGELVDVEGRLGLQITRMASPA